MAGRTKVLIELLPAAEGEVYSHMLIDGAEQEVCAVFFDLTAGREAMTVWHRDGSGPAEARRFLEQKLAGATQEHGSQG